MTRKNVLSMLILCAGLPRAAQAQAVPPDDGAAPELNEPVSIKERMIKGLPEAIGDGLDFDVWGWLGGLWHDGGEHYWDGELSFSITKSFQQRVAVTAQLNLIDANDVKRAELEQGFISARLWDRTIVTVGKFNANFGIEARDFWNRTTGTPSLLFGAMVSVPIGETGLTIKPFVSTDFQGQWHFDQPISAGAKLEWAPDEKLKFGLTNWVGPGFSLFRGKPLHSPYPADAYGSDPASASENWQGPHLVAMRHGTLYFVDANVKWKIRKDVTLSGEFLTGSTGTFGHTYSWLGGLIMADWAITDRVHTFARVSVIDDKDWIVTGFFQKRQEYSVGAGWSSASRGGTTRATRRPT